MGVNFYTGKYGIRQKKFQIKLGWKFNNNFDLKHGQFGLRHKHFYLWKESEYHSSMLKLS